MHNADLKAAIASGKVSRYVTDFPTEETINTDGIIAIPHLGASTEESEDNCAVMAAHELIEYLCFGNITNSVNFPDVSMPMSAEFRICILHKNVPAVLSSVSSLISEQGINIDNMLNKSKGDYAYTIVDTSTSIEGDIVDKIQSVEGVIRVNLY